MESHCIPFREIPHTSRLFTDFLEDFRRVAPYYAHPPTLEGVKAAAGEVRLDSDLRRGVVEILRGQNQGFAQGGAMLPDVARNLDRLAQGACAIVTGQQVGLFSGPALTFHKAIAAAEVAQDLTKAGVEAVPVFWLPTEDHDFAEINHCTWVTRTGAAKYELPPRAEDAGHHVGEIVLGEDVLALADAAAKTLEGSYAEQVGSALRESYGSGETYGSAFGKLLARLLAGKGVILLDPLDARFHKLARPVYRRVIENADSLAESLLARDKELEAAGFHAQVKVTREAILLFLDVEGKREPLRQRKGGFAATSAELSKDDLLAVAQSQPERLGPNALLRPVVQDFLLPTAAYIGGPAEVAYMAQAQVVYKKVLGRMPAILPRPSFTLIEPPAARFLAQHELDFRAMLRGAQHVRALMEQRAIPGALAARFDATESQLRAMMKEYEEPLRQLDATLLDAWQSTEQKILHQLGQLRAKAGRAADFRNGVLDRHQRILFDALYPDGGLQERTNSFLPALAANGPALLDELARFSSLNAGGKPSACLNQHHVLYL
jgi:bacillithiol biosynthesis cysteine-adding enzyme BshC